MQLDRFVLRFHQVQNDVTAIFVEAFAIAEPLLAVLVSALHDCLRIVNSTVGAGMGRQIVEVVKLDHLVVVWANCSHWPNTLTAVHCANGARNL